MPHLLDIILIANLLTLLLMWWDKRAATRGGWRIPEASFFLLALLGGSLMLLLSMQWFRHKTKKASFRWRAILIIPVQCLLLLGWWFSKGM